MYRVWGLKINSRLCAAKIFLKTHIFIYFLNINSPCFRFTHNRNLFIITCTLLIFFRRMPLLTFSFSYKQNRKVWISPIFYLIKDTTILNKVIEFVTILTCIFFFHIWNVSRLHVWHFTLSTHQTFAAQRCWMAGWLWEM